MKKRFIVPALAAALCVSALVGCATNDKGPDPVDQGGLNVYPVSNYRDSQEIYMGDVMPFYDNGVMNIYHLQDKVGSLYMYYHPISRLTTTDYLHYKDEGVALNYEEKINSPDAALGTGSVIKDKDGKYHFFYTGHGASREDVAPDPLEVIRHATSSDQKTWTKDEAFKIKGNSANFNLNHDFRDPYVYYDNGDETYYMLVTARDVVDGTEKGVIKYYASTTLDATADGWEYKGIFFENDAGIYNMECPSYVELNGVYYLAYSEQGSNRVTHYRYRTKKDGEYGEWQKFDRDTIDGEGFYAGRLEKAGDKLYAFAWCARLKNGDSGVFDWGGNLVAHEIVKGDNGELKAVMVSAVKDALKTKVDYKPVSGEKTDSLSFKANKFSAVGYQALTGNATRMSFKIKAGSDKGDFGLTFGIDGAYDNRLGKAVIAFEPENGRIACYNGVTNILRYGSPLTALDFKYEKDREYNVEVLYQNDLCTVYLDGNTAFTVRIPNTAKCNFAFYSNGVKADVKEIAFYE